jgi:hypothetical protein
MRAAARTGFALLAALCATPAPAQVPDDALKVYAVHVVKTTPFEKPFTGDGVYLGKGAVLTAAHVIGRWGFLKNPRVLIASQDLPASIVKEGSLDDVDLTVLSVDPARLPIRLRLRRNPLCKTPPRIGQPVIVVNPQRAARSHIMSPMLIEPKLRARFKTLTSELVGGSGSGVYDAGSHCLRGIVSRKIQKLDYHFDVGKLVVENAGFAGYFVPAAAIAKFLPEEFRF